MEVFANFSRFVIYNQCSFSRPKLFLIFKFPFSKRLKKILHLRFHRDFIISFLFIATIGERVVAAKTHKIGAGVT